MSSSHPDPVEQAEEALRRSEARYRALAQATSQAVWTWDPTTFQGEFHDTQRWWEEITGQTPEEQRENWFDRIHPGDRERVREIWNRSIATGEPYHVEYRILAKNGGTRSVLARAVAVRGPQGEIRDWVGSLSDVTDQRLAESALREADRRKDEFLAMLAHELRNPLAPIRNAVEVLRRLGPDEPRLDQAREMIERQAAHMAHLVDDLLDVSRISRGKILLRKERLDLVLLVRATAEDHRSLLENAGLTLSLDLPDKPLWVSGDPTRLSQIVGNLLQNSHKFTNPGGQVTVQLREEEGRAVLRAADTGIGMEPEILAQLFEPFTQADQSLDRSRGGLGLGLSLIKGLVDLHGGEVRAASGGRGSGSTFTVLLPLEASQEAETVRGPERAIPSGAPHRPLRILIVEDNRDAADSLRLILELAGHEVEVAYTGKAGLEAARRFHPGVALCDIGLPGGMDGYALAHALRQAPETAGAYLVAISGYGQEEDKRRSREAGFDRHLTKPVDPSVLMKLLETQASAA